MEQNKSTTVKQSLRKELYALIAIIVVAVLLILFVFRNSLFGMGTGYQDVISQYFTAISERDFDSYTGTMLPEIAADYEAEKADLEYSDYQYMDELYYDVFDEFGEDAKITLTFGDATRPDDEYIDYFAESYEEIYGSSINTANVYGVYVSANFSGSLSESDIEFECFVLKTGGRWYMVGCDFWTTEDDE